MKEQEFVTRHGCGGPKMGKRTPLNYSEYLRAVLHSISLGECSLL